VDSRANVDVDGDVLVYSYLDLRARFLLVPAISPVLTSAVRVRVHELFDADPDTNPGRVVAPAGDRPVTPMPAPQHIPDTHPTPRGEPHAQWQPVLPLVAATRSMLEQRAPEWPPFDFDHAGGDPLDLSTMVTGIARTILAREAARSYRGEKRRAYKE